MNNSKNNAHNNHEEEDHAAVEVDGQEAPDSWRPDFHWLTEDVAIGGCFPLERARELAETYGIEAVVDLRGEECDDRAILRAAGIDLLHLPTPDMDAASQQHLAVGVSFVRSQAECGKKVLIHCQHGIGRSALLGLCVLIDRGWAPLDALVHAKNRREVVSPSRSQFEGWSAWLRSQGLTPPDYHAFGCIAYRHLGGE